MIWSRLFRFIKVVGHILAYMKESYETREKWGEKKSYRKKECNREMANKYILGWIHRRIPLSVSGLSVYMQTAMAAEERHDANICTNEQ